MLERLLEYWLDSVNERTYQPAFCQLLAAQNYKIIHSTRHMPIEFGKDIIAIDSNGQPVAFQLKGNPGSRLTLNQFREISPQLNELVTQKIVYPGVPHKPHHSYLVTNGEVEEEVQRAIDDFNRNLDDMGFAPKQRLGIIARGEFLNWLSVYGAKIWPIEIYPMNALLALLVADGEDFYPLQNLDSMLRGALGLDESSPSVKNASELKRRVFGAAVMTAVSLTNFDAKQNHFAAASAWTLFIIYVHCAFDRYKFSVKAAQQALQIARGAIWASLGQIFNDVAGRIDQLSPNHPDADQTVLYKMATLEGAGLHDFVAFKGRLLLVSSLLSLYWFWCEEEGWLNEGKKEEFERIFPVPVSGLELWGEGAVPQILMHLSHWREVDATQNPNILLSQLLGMILRNSTNRAGNGIPSPYYSYEDVTRHKYVDLLPRQPDKLEREDFRKTSFVAEGIYHLLVRTNLKTYCKGHWPFFSDMLSNEFKPEKRWQFGLLKCRRGKTIQRQQPASKNWEDFKLEARAISCPGIPPSMLDDRFVLALFSILAPHRLTPELTRYLGYRFFDVWFLEPPIE